MLTLLLGQMKSYSGSHFLYLYHVEHSLLSSCLSVSGFKFRFLSHLELVFVQVNQIWSNFILLHVGIQFFPAPFLKTLSFLQSMFFGIFFKYEIDEVKCIHVWVFDFVPIKLHVYFSASSILFLLVWQCNISWDQWLQSQ